MSGYRQGWFKASEPAGPCPEADELWSFSRGALAAERRDALRAHLTECVWCAEKAARLNDPIGPTGLAGPTSPAEPVPDALNRKLRKHWTVSPLQRVWRSQALWMILFITSVGVSFAASRHYKQWLVIALVTGIRWAMAERAGRQILSVRRIGGSAGTGRDAGRIRSGERDSVI